MTAQNCTGDTCGSCAFWRGVREIDTAQGGVKVTPNAIGICTERWRGMSKRESDTCDQWQEWMALELARAA